MKPIIKYSNIISYMNIGGISLFPFIILKEKYNYNTRVSKVIKNHETIHFYQQLELLVIPFYLLYILEWFIKLFIYGKDAYIHISFEREAYKYESDVNYISNRKWYSSFYYIF